jgi:uncharacterized membrane protein YkvI
MPLSKWSTITLMAIVVTLPVTGILFIFVGFSEMNYQQYSSLAFLFLVALMISLANYELRKNKLN